MTTNNEIREFLRLPINTKLEVEIEQVDAIDSTNSNTLMFINSPGMNLYDLDRSKGNVYLINEAYPEFNSYRNDFIRVSNPKYKFCRVVSHFSLASKLQRNFDNSMSYDTLSKLDRDNLYTLDVIVGKNCKIDRGAIIGGTDFSPVIGDTPDELVQFPQMGGVIIGDNVVIKYNTMVGKGTFGYTKIGNNTMIDFGCQIGHNCSIGKSCIIAAGTIIGGSTTVGNNTVIGIGAKIRNGLKIGNNVSIGMGSVVVKDIPDNSVVVGNPARRIDHDRIFSEGGLI